MTSWEVTDLREDGGRWLIVYKVPLDYAPDGTYSVSLPKSMFNQYAALFGYDLDDPQHLDDLFDHVTYIAYVNEVLHREGRGHEVIGNPYEVDPAQARETIKAQIAEFKESRPIIQAARPAQRARGFAATDLRDVHEVLRSDMLSRLDKKQVAEATEVAVATRRSLQTLAPTQETQ